MSPAPCAACDGTPPAPRKPRRQNRRSFDRRFHVALALPKRAPPSTTFAAHLTLRQRKIAGRPLAEIAERLDFLLAVGLGYLSLDRSAATLSGGEAQRIRLATQIGSRLRGVLYVLDEPSIGLHARDNDRLLGSLEQLARSRQHRARRRARRRNHSPRRLRGRSRPRRGQCRRTSRRRRTARGNRRESRIAHRPISFRRAREFPCRSSAAATNGKAITHPGRARTTI